ncbi:MAG: hypothetical protein KA902_02720, partial [Arenimonas sp.]|nr:hypothetical protein [Arenimonas sp.]
MYINLTIPIEFLAPFIQRMITILRLIPLLLTMLWLHGCSSAPVVTDAKDDSLFHDNFFEPNNHPFETKSVFELSPEMHTYLRNSVQSRQNSSNAKSLVSALYDVNRLQLEYESSYTRNAKEAFAAKKGNCISLVIMTAAFAKEMGL